VNDLQTRAELTKLARLLGAPEAALEFLASRGHGELRDLEARISAALFDEHRAAFGRLADASKLLPASLVAKMSELVFGPMLSARVSGAMPPDRAVEVASKLRMKFLTDVTVQLDPRNAAAILQRIPVDIVVGVARMLLERGEHVTMGRFVDYLPDAAIRAVIANVEDDIALLRITGYVERRERLVELIDMVPPERVKRIVAAVAEGPADVRLAGFVMMSQLSDAQQGRLGDIAIALGPERLKALVSAAGKAGANDVLRGVLGRISPESKVTLLKILPGYLVS